MIKHMDMVFINILMVLNMKDNGLKIDKVVKVLKLGLMVLVMLAVIKMGKNAVKENLNGLMDHLTSAEARRTYLPCLVRLG